MDESEYLFQLQQKSRRLGVFHIPKKELKTITLEFTLPKYSGFSHLNGSLYLGGGFLNERYLTQFKKIDWEGRI